MLLTTFTLLTLSSLTMKAMAGPVQVREHHTSTHGDLTPSPTPSHTWESYGSAHTPYSYQPINTEVPPAPPCVITNEEVAGKELSGCLIINSKVLTSRVSNSILLNSYVTGSQLSFVAVTGGAITLSLVDNTLIQNATVTQSTLTAVAAQLTTLDTNVLAGVNLQAGLVTNSTGAQVAAQDSTVQGDNDFNGATVQFSDVSGGKFNLIAFSTCDSIDGAKITQANLQNVVVKNSQINGANIQDFLLINTKEEGNILKQAEKLNPFQTV
ncbi:hypothetical protein UCRPA7_8307 [Phaeoacremonium minimum UCRPA7]|uniref:Uncharacterized protein n=1 Tax=Phaeoacremonium minimum (strain UCR-PA7) TaxID=1286976 RepID=R8BA56_PHAM7|nr:hypothetical protein UCRPA7_8307 [Phaeoacremonium minimum UCRPA7]EON96204.1 hypothetical protein UCRPA7_8307 [Phaeoacremonium minimum UCRPA7]